MRISSLLLMASLTRTRPGRPPQHHRPPALPNRRMEVGRRVRFSEEVVAIAPVVFDISMGTDSDLDSPPEDSETEEEPGGGAKEGDGAPARPPPPPPTQAPLPPPSLPAWIRALKGKSGKKKNR
ncbi:unnamed protein product [Arctogadus glacialis]